MFLVFLLKIERLKIQQRGKRKQKKTEKLHCCYWFASVCMCARAKNNRRKRTFSLPSRSVLLLFCSLVLMCLCECCDPSTIELTQRKMCAKWCKDDEWEIDDENEKPKINRRLLCLIDFHLWIGVSVIGCKCQQDFSALQCDCVGAHHTRYLLCSACNKLSRSRARAFWRVCVG